MGTAGVSPVRGKRGEPHCGQGVEQAHDEGNASEAGDEECLERHGEEPLLPAVPVAQGRFQEVCSFHFLKLFVFTKFLFQAEQGG
mgnify:CR=1 FL=1